ncbi:MAG: SAM-dependent methyltransferase [Solobacterium sp.]|nr:SAM-dependent methyltransferase [Solobacterium sp.]
MNQRIIEIAGMVKQGMVTADIGTDHAQLPVLLIREGIADKAYACDIGEGPLSMAAENVRNAGLQDRIGVILSDGFEHVPEDTQCAVIAGMGCQTAIGILERAEERLPELEQIIVQVNTDVPVFRAWLSGRRYTVEAEKLIRDHGHDYIALSFTCADHEPYSEQEILCGIRLAHDEAYAHFAAKQISTLEFILSKRKERDPQLEHQLELWKDAYHKAAA